MEMDGLFAFELNEAEGYWSVTRCYGKGEEVVFPVFYKGKPVKKVGDDKFSPFKKRVKTIKRVIIPEGYTSIGERAFLGCEELTSIELPESFASIGEMAFFDCIGLTEIKLPDSITTIRKEAFLDCIGLMNIKLPESLASIEERAFGDCISLTDIKLPKSLASIGEGAFGFCTGLTEIKLPESLASIGEAVFCGCTGLTEISVDENNSDFCSFDGVMFDKTMITLILFPEGKKGKYSVPDGIVAIESNAFNNCKITGISIPESFQSIDSFGFHGNQLTDITVSELNSVFCSIDGVLFDKKKHKLIEYPRNKNKTDYVVPEGIKFIEPFAFNGCKRLVNIVLPQSLELIGDHVFAGCEGLKAIILPMSLQYIGEHVFEDCPNLETVTLSRKTKRGQKAFMGFKGRRIYVD